MRLHSALLTVLACSALSACGGGKASGERERPEDFRAAANEVCREHNARLDEQRERVRGKQVTLEEAVEVVDGEAQVREDQIRELRALKPPPEAKAYLARLERNAVGIRKAARQLEADRGKSYDEFWTTLHNSEDAANKEAEALGLSDCSPPLAA